MPVLTNPTPDALHNWFATANIGEVCQVVTTDHSLLLMKRSDDMVQWRIDTPSTSDGHRWHPKMSRYDLFEDVLRMWTGNGPTAKDSE